MTDHSASQDRQVLVCQYRSCLQQGADEVLEQFHILCPEGLTITSSGCMGQCSIGVTVRVLPDNTWYCNIRPNHVARIITDHLQGDRPIQALLHPRFHPTASPSPQPLDSPREMESHQIT